MKRFSWLAAAVLLALSACNRDGTGAVDEVATVQVMPDQRVLAVGEALELKAVVRDEGGEAPSDDRLAGLVWSTDNAAVATVSAAGVVTGVAPGTANIRAELDGKSGSVQVTVSAVPLACNAGGPVRSLAVGGAVVLGGVQAATVCLDGGATGKEYVAVPFNAGDADPGLLAVRLTGQGIIPVAPGVPSLAPSLSLEGGRVQDTRFHERLRERAEGELARHVGAALRTGRAARDGMRPSMVLNLASPSLGQTVTVNTSLESCGNATNRTGRVVAVSARAVVLADEANPAGGLTAADYASMAMGFDTLVYPLVTQTFGEPRDVDGNGKVVIFYTSAVNALTPPGSSAFVGGFFHPRDLFPLRDRDGLAACQSTNYAEMFYMLVPDPQGAVNNNVFSRDAILQTSLGTIAHEFQHLINASRRLYVIETTHWNEETWLNEGLSHISEEVLFYRASGLGPRSNIRAEQIQSDVRVQRAFASYMDQNIRRYQRFLEEHETQSPYFIPTTGNDLAMRGASWAFLRYAADLRGGSDTELWRDLVDGDVTGLANLQQALGRDPRPLVRDWTTAVYTDDVVPNLEARFTQPSWNFRSFFTNFPASTRNLAANGENTVLLRSGSGAYARFGVGPALTATFAARRTGGEPLPSQAYVTIVRTK
jgi:hypothetical protein